MLHAGKYSIPIIEIVGLIMKDQRRKIIRIYRQGDGVSGTRTTNRQNSSAHNMSQIITTNNERRYQSPDRRKRYVSGKKYHHRNRCICRTNRMQR